MLLRESKLSFYGSLQQQGLTMCAGIDKYSDPNSPIHDFLFTASLTIGTIVTGSALIGAWAKKEGDHQLATTQKTLIEHQEKIKGIKEKIANLKNQG